MPRVPKDIDSRDYYVGLLEPELNFNKFEITLSHLFRERLPVLGDRNYSECLYEFLRDTGRLRSEILEVGGGLGDLAYNFLEADRAGSKLVMIYRMLDVSPALLHRQRERLASRVGDFLPADCLEMSEYISPFSGLIISNGVIADLRSVYISSNDKPETYGIEDPEILDFVAQWSDGKEGWYLHIGALLFLRQISTTLHPDGAAFVSEYAATELNQPSWFNNHWECGIDFDQIANYADRLGLEVEVNDIETVLGLSPEQEFLSVDLFTSQDRIALEIPASVKIWRGEKPLPVLAYTRESLPQALKVSNPTLGDEEAAELAGILNDRFHSIHDRRFDQKNPTTWGYRCLLVRKRHDDELRNVVASFAVPMIAKTLDTDEEDARARFDRAYGEARMGLTGDPTLDALIVSALTRLAISLGRVCLKFLFEKYLDQFLSDKGVSERDRKRTRLAARELRKNAEWQRTE